MPREEGLSLEVAALEEEDGLEEEEGDEEGLEEGSEDGSEEGSGSEEGFGSEEGLGSEEGFDVEGRRLEELPGEELDDFSSASAATVAPVPVDSWLVPE